MWHSTTPRRFCGVSIVPGQFLGVSERSAFVPAYCRSETVRPQRRLYAPWKGRRQTSAGLRATKRCEARWGEAVSASRIRPSPRRGRLGSPDAATTRRPRQPVVAGLLPLLYGDKGLVHSKPIRRGSPGRLRPTPLRAIPETAPVWGRGDSARFPFHRRRRCAILRRKRR
jgi:hypothetical protein